MLVAVYEAMLLLTNGVGLESVKCIDICRIGSPTERRESVSVFRETLSRALLKQLHNDTPL
jgi:hypothetical protein